MIDYKIEDLVFSEFLPEMFRRVGLDESNINDLTKMPNWFSSSNWTVEDETKFKEWLVQRLMHKLKLCKSTAQKEADWFVFNFGWSTGEEKQGELNLE